MRILLDECLPKPLKRDLQGHVVLTVTEAGWSGVRNGALLGLAEDTFDVFMTVDKSIVYQQNIAAHDIAIVLLVGLNNRLETLRPLMPQVMEALQTVRPGQVVQVGTALRVRQ